MISIGKKIYKRRLFVFTLAFLVHLVFLLLLTLIEVKIKPVKKDNSSILLVEVQKPIREITGKKQQTKPVKINHQAKIIKQDNIEKRNNKLENKKVQTEKIADRNLIADSLKLPQNEFSDSVKIRLKYAQTLLDTFLITHPGFAKYILKEQSKYLAQNENERMLTRLKLEKKIKNELNKYIKENFPEGSEHAMSDKAGPGMQIPIDGVIDAIKKLFQ